MSVKTHENTASSIQLGGGRWALEDPPEQKPQKGSSHPDFRALTINPQANPDHPLMTDTLRKHLSSADAGIPEARKELVLVQYYSLWAHAASGAASQRNGLKSLDRPTGVSTLLEVHSIVHLDTCAA